MSSLSFLTVFEFALRWLHLFFGVMWIGHLYYFNFTQGAFMNAQDVDASAKAAVRTRLLPAALYYFRWGAMWTFVTGVLYWGHKAHGFGGFANYLTSSYGLVITIGAVLGITMWANVWFVIWPCQKIVIENANRVAKGESALPNAADAAARANVGSRTNTLFSIPMLFMMGAASHLPLAVTESSNLTAFWIGFFVLYAGLQGNALKGKTYKIMTTIPQVVTSGVVFTAAIVGLLAITL
jgi:uncharacterized membrane protein